MSILRSDTALGTVLSGFAAESCLLPRHNSAGEGCKEAHQPGKKSALGLVDKKELVAVSDSDPTIPSECVLEASSYAKMEEGVRQLPDQAESCAERSCRNRRFQFVTLSYRRSTWTKKLLGEELKRA